MKKVTNKSRKIGESSTLQNILKQAKAQEILSKHGVPCITCPMAKFEIDKLQIGEVCKMYGINLQELLNDLNK